MQTVAETHETPASSCPDAGLAVAWRCQAPPERRSTSAEALFRLRIRTGCPCRGAGACRDTPDSVQDARSGPAIAWTAHVLRESALRSGPPLLLEIPTAVQLSAAVHETP